MTLASVSSFPVMTSFEFEGYSFALAALWRNLPAFLDFPAEYLTFIKKYGILRVWEKSHRLLRSDLDLNRE